MKNKLYIKMEQTFDTGNGHAKLGVTTAMMMMISWSNVLN
jgi:hypothetical protein